MSSRSAETPIEEQILAKGLTAPRVTPDSLEAKIDSEAYYIFAGSCLTICSLTLENGFNVTGESACASPENFNEQIGRTIARRNAVDKIWALEGYLLKQRLFEATT